MQTDTRREKDSKARTTTSAVTSRWLVSTESMTLCCATHVATPISTRTDTPREVLLMVCVPEWVPPESPRSKAQLADLITSLLELCRDRGRLPRLRGDSVARLSLVVYSGVPSRKLCDNLRVTHIDSAQLEKDLELMLLPPLESKAPLAVNPLLFCNHPRAWADAADEADRWIEQNPWQRRVELVFFVGSDPRAPSDAELAQLPPQWIEDACLYSPEARRDRWPSFGELTATLRSWKVTKHQVRTTVLLGSDSDAGLDSAPYLALVPDWENDCVVRFASRACPAGRLLAFLWQRAFGSPAAVDYRVQHTVHLGATDAERGYRLLDLHTGLTDQSHVWQTHCHGGSLHLRVFRLLLPAGEHEGWRVRWEGKTVTGRVGRGGTKLGESVYVSGSPSDLRCPAHLTSPETRGLGGLAMLLCRAARVANQVQNGGGATTKTEAIGVATATLKAVCARPPPGGPGPAPPVSNAIAQIAQILHFPVDLAELVVSFTDWDVAPSKASPLPHVQTRSRLPSSMTTAAWDTTGRVGPCFASSGCSVCAFHYARLDAGRRVRQWLGPAVCPLPHWGCPPAKKKTDVIYEGAPACGDFGTAWNVLDSCRDLSDLGAGCLLLACVPCSLQQALNVEGRLRDEECEPWSDDTVSRARTRASRQEDFVPSPPPSPPRHLQEAKRRHEQLCALFEQVSTAKKSIETNPFSNFFD